MALFHSQGRRHWINNFLISCQSTGEFSLLLWIDHINENEIDPDQLASGAGFILTLVSKECIKFQTVMSTVHLFTQILLRYFHFLFMLPFYAFRLCFKILLKWIAESTSDIQKAGSLCVLRDGSLETIFSILSFYSFRLCLIRCFLRFTLKLNLRKHKWHSNSWLPVCTWRWFSRNSFQHLILLQL